MLYIVTPPAVEPVSVSELQRQLNIDVGNAEPCPTAPTVALVVAAGLVTAGAHRYRVTFVTADGETEGGAVSAAVTTILATHGQVALTGIPLGGSRVTSRNLYRTEADGTTYLKLAALANNTVTIYTDNIADASLGAECPATNTTDDPFLLTKITSARQYAETFMRRACCTQTWDWKLDGFPFWGEPLELPMAPLQSVTSVGYLDTAGAAQTWTVTTDYTVDTPSGDHAMPGRIIPVYGVSYPSTQDVPNAVTIRFVCGYGVASAVPQGIKDGILLHATRAYVKREALDDEDLLGVNRQLWPYRVP